MATTVVEFNNKYIIISFNLFEPNQNVNNQVQKFFSGFKYINNDNDNGNFKFIYVPKKNFQDIIEKEKAIIKNLIDIYINIYFDKVLSTEIKKLTTSLQQNAGRLSSSMNFNRKTKKSGGGLLNIISRK
jgi:hypothetical protein